MTRMRLLLAMGGALGLTALILKGGSIDLPFTWAVLIAAAVLLYVLLDGFDLGLGILFPLARSDRDRDVMMNSVAPIWDGNETWLVLGGGGLFAAFPLAYAVLMPAFYMPIGFMLTALIFRGVAFEFRFKAGPDMRRFWDQAFHWGSVVATLSQGIMLGTFVQGIAVVSASPGTTEFAGSAFDWLSPFSFVTGCALVCGYALLASTWLIMKTEGDLEAWARRVAVITAAGVVVAMGVVSFWVLFLDLRIANRWGLAWPDLRWGRLLSLSPIPVLVAATSAALVRSVRHGHTFTPFCCGAVLFVLGYFGIGFSLYPMIVPYSVTIWQAAAAPNSQWLLLVGIAVLLPIILGYTAYSYWVFRGKVQHDVGYH
jgi:cytochrome bd ubiquinol oxidase subunit II